MSIAAAATLAGCAAFSPDGGMDAVQEIAGTALSKDVVALRTAAEAEAARAAVVDLLKRPLSADAAVQIALLNNRGLQAAYAELAVAEARRVGESLPPNPTIALSRISGPLEIEIEKQIVANVLALATLPVRSEIALTRFRQAQLRAPRKRCASQRKRGAPITARSQRANWSPS
jgi:hypothetical protein